MEKVTGVYWAKTLEKWRAMITVKGIKHDLGVFENHSDAVNARKKAEEDFGVKKSFVIGDLEGERFGLFTVIGDTGNRTPKGCKILLCRHEDGTLHEINKEFLVNGSSKGIGIGSNQSVGKTGEKYITKLPSGNYHIQKSINGKMQRFGTFPTLEQAIDKRDEVLKLIEQGKL